MGTLFYMAPELIDGSGGDPLQCDVYRYHSTVSFLHFMLTIFTSF